MRDKPERHAILSGVGQSAIGRRLFRTDLDLTSEAALAAIADAGLTPDDIDGLATYPGPIGAAPGGFTGKRKNLASTGWGACLRPRESHSPGAFLVGDSIKQGCFCARL